MISSEVRPTCLWLSSFFLVLVVLLITSPRTASAYFRVCNDTGHKIQVAVGYESSLHQDWVSEGWYGIQGGNCGTILNENLTNTKYYLYAKSENNNLVWKDKYYFCTSEKPFTIVGDKDCTGRGYSTNYFFEVNVGNYLSWTHRLTDTSESASTKLYNPTPISSIDVIWTRVNSVSLISQLTPEEMLLLGLGAIAGGEDFYGARVKITNTGNTPVAIDPDNIRFLFDGRYRSALSPERGQFLKSTVLQPNYYVEGTVIFAAPSESGGYLQYNDNTINVSYNSSR